MFFSDYKVILNIHQYDKHALKINSFPMSIFSRLFPIIFILGRFNLLKFFGAF